MKTLPYFKWYAHQIILKVRKSTKTQIIFETYKIIGCFVNELFSSSLCMLFFSPFSGVYIFFFPWHSVSCLFCLKSSIVNKGWKKKFLPSCSITMPPSDILDDPARLGSGSTVRRSFFPLHPYCGNQAFMLISENTGRHQLMVTSSVKTVEK